MGGFFRKVAGAFVYLDEENEKSKGNPDAASLEEMSRETSELIAQLSSSPRSSSPAAGASGVPAPTTASPLDMTADAVFVSAGIADTQSSAQRVLKIIAGLSMFSRDQQILMVRAMDAADEAWSEKEVLEDARRRQSALRSHLQDIESERSTRLQSVAGRIDKAQADGKRRLGEIDQQIAELQKLRQDAVSTTTAALAELEVEKKQTEDAAEKARRGITAVINALSELITFFVGTDGRPVAKS